MATLSYDLIEEILDVAETYAAKEKERLSHLVPPQGRPVAAERRTEAPSPRRARHPRGGE